MRIRILLLSALAFTSTNAQVTHTVVTGVVFDSVAHAPLAGAVVQAVAVDSLRGPIARAYSAITDAAGRYRLVDLPAGRFAIGFQHRALDVLGIDSPLTGFELSGSNAVVNLGVPGGEYVRTLACGKEQRLDGEGMLVGYALDARGDSALKGAVVKARWVELALENRNYHSVTRVVTAVTDDEGRFRACGVTSDDAVRVEISKNGFHVISSTLNVPRDGTMRRDFYLSSTSAARPMVGLTGRVSHADGSVVQSGRASIAALSADVPITAGAFTFPSLPPGTWLVETNSLGLEPQSLLVDVLQGENAPAFITMVDRAQRLDAVTVLGKPAGSQKILDAISARRRYTNGTVYLPGNDWLAIARDPADLVRDAAGFRYINSEKVLASGCGYRDLPTERQVVVNTEQRARDRVLAIYLDGLRVMGGLPELRTAVTMRDVLAVEAYQDVATAPIEWRTYDACAVLAIWTKRR